MKKWETKIKKGKGEKDKERYHKKSSAAKNSDYVSYLIRCFLLSPSTGSNIFIFVWFTVSSLPTSDSRPVHPIKPEQSPHLTSQNIHYSIIDNLSKQTLSLFGSYES